MIDKDHPCYGCFHNYNNKECRYTGVQKYDSCGNVCQCEKTCLYHNKVIS